MVETGEFHPELCRDRSKRQKRRRHLSGQRLLGFLHANLVTSGPGGKTIGKLRLGRKEIGSVVATGELHPPRTWDWAPPHRTPGQRRWGDSGPRGMTVHRGRLGRPRDRDLLVEATEPAETRPQKGPGLYG